MTTDTTMTPAAMPTATTVTTAKKRRGGLWLALAITACLVLLLIGSLIVQGLAAVPALDVTIDGERVVSGWSIGQALAGLGPLEQIALAGAVMVAVLAMVVVLPLTLAIAGVTIGFVLLLAVGIPLLVGLSILGVLAAPLLLLGWLVWKAAS